MMGLSDRGKASVSPLGQNLDLKIRIIHGEDDGATPCEDSTEFAAPLAKAGYDLKLIPFSGGHTVPFELKVQTVMEAAGD